MSIVVVAAVVPVPMDIATVAIAAPIGAVVTVAIYEKPSRLAASPYHHPVAIACTKEIAAYAHRWVGIGRPNGAGARVHGKRSLVLVQTCLEFAEAGSKSFVKLPLELLLLGHNEKRRPYYILYTYIQYTKNANQNKTFIVLSLMKIVDWADKLGQRRNSLGSESAEKARKVNIYKERENSINKHEIEWKQNQENIYTRKTLK